MSEMSTMSNTDIILLCIFLVICGHLIFKTIESIGNDIKNFIKSKNPQSKKIENGFKNFEELYKDLSIYIALEINSIFEKSLKPLMSKDLSDSNRLISDEILDEYTKKIYLSIFKSLSEDYLRKIYQIIDKEHFEEFLLNMIYNELCSLAINLNKDTVRRISK